MLLAWWFAFFMSGHGMILDEVLSQKSTNNWIMTCEGGSLKIQCD